MAAMANAICCYTMLAFYLLAVGAIVGMLASRKPGSSRLGYVATGIVGAFIGAFLTFGDVPFLLRHPSLNPLTVSIATSVLLVTVVRVIAKKVSRPSPRLRL